MTPSLIKEKCLVKIAYKKSVLTTQIIRFCFFKKDIPGYFFKDDALQLEGAIRRFVHQYVTHYYKSTQILLRFRLWVCWSNAMSVFQAAYFWNIFSNAELLSTNNLLIYLFQWRWRSNCERRWRNSRVLSRINGRKGNGWISGMWNECMLPLYINTWLVRTWMYRYLGYKEVLFVSPVKFWKKKSLLNYTVITKLDLKKLRI